MTSNTLKVSIAAFLIIIMYALSVASAEAGDRLFNRMDSTIQSGVNTFGSARRCTQFRRRPINNRPRVYTRGLRNLVPWEVTCDYRQLNRQYNGVTRYRPNQWKNRTEKDWINDGVDLFLGLGTE